MGAEIRAILTDVGTPQPSSGGLAQTLLDRSRWSRPRAASARRSASGCRPVQVTGRPAVPTPAVILHTNVISELMRAAPDTTLQHWVREVPPDLVCTTSVTLAKVRFDAAAANHYADVVVERARTGIPIAGFDAHFAAICRVDRTALATRNTDNFTWLGLDLIDPWLAAV
jgi:predicted nucleic acid-binding protein